MSDILTPLPEKLRPTSIENILGQKKILSNDGVLSRIIKKKILSSFILWGPPGCGKTTIAKAISNELNIETFEISAVLSGVKDLRVIFEKGEKNFLNGKQTILFVDEIHRFNKGQQDSFLPYLEKGIVSLIGATTENPSFSIISALLSRCQVIKLEKLNAIQISISSWQAFERLGSPEGELSIAQLVIYLSTCPKSNSVYKAWKETLEFTKKNPYNSPPMSILNAPTKMMKDLGYGKGYVYDHETDNGFSGQNCFPENVKRKTFYHPIERGYEREIKKRLNWWNKLRNQNE